MTIRVITPQSERRSLYPHPITRILNGIQTTPRTRKSNVTNAHSCKANIRKRSKCKEVAASPGSNSKLQRECLLASRFRTRRLIPNCREFIRPRRNGKIEGRAVLHALSGSPSSKNGFAFNQLRHPGKTGFQRCQAPTACARSPVFERARLQSCHKVLESIGL